MNILAFDTSTAACSVALQHDDQVTVLHEIAPKQQANLILSMMKELLHRTSLTFLELDAIAYGCGPGSFTGVRIASSVAQGIGFVTNCPIVPISSLSAIAQTAFEERGWQTLFIALDARVEQLYWAVYEVNSAGYVDLRGEEEIVFPDQITIDQITIDQTITLAKEKIGYGIGEGWEKYEQKLTKKLGIKPIAIQIIQYPNAESILKLAKIKLHEGKWVSAPFALPIYLR